MRTTYALAKYVRIEYHKYMKHLDLFSGIGGAALAVEAIWPEATHIFVESDPFCQAILKKHWPEATIFGDINEFVERLTGMTTEEYHVKYGFTTQPEIRPIGDDVRAGHVDRRDSGLFQSDAPSDVEDITKEGMQNAPEPAIQDGQPFLSWRGTGGGSGSQHGGVRIEEGSTDTPRTMRDVPHKRERKGDTGASSRLQQTSRSNVAMPALPSSVAQRQQSETTERLKNEPIFILTGGFPCPSFSQAGKRRGTKDDRWLWPQMFAIIHRLRPEWVIAENVGGFITWEGGLALDKVITDLEAAGYEAWPIVIPAVAVNAPHRRDRIWIVAHSEHQPAGNPKPPRKGKRTPSGASGSDSDAANPAGDRRSRAGAAAPLEKGHEARPEPARQLAGRFERPYSDDSDAERAGLERKPENETAGQPRQFGRTRRNERYGWERNWLEVATELCGVFNGLSRELDKIMNDGLLLKYAQTFSKVTRQDLPHLWKGFQSESFQWNIGRFDTVQNKDYLFAVLWKLAFESKKRVSLPFESEEVQSAYLYNMWQEKESGRPSPRSEYKEQYAIEHKDALSSLSYEIALATAEIQKSFLKDRNSRLKGLGNAWVPQVAMEIMKGIKNIEDHGTQKLHN